MIDSLDMTDPVSDAFIYSFQNNSPLSSNSITDFNNNNVLLTKSDIGHGGIDCLYHETNIDDSIDLSINHLNFHDDTPIKRNELSTLKTDDHHHILENKIKIFTEPTPKPDIFMNEENNNLRIQSANSNMFLQSTQSPFSQNQQTQHHPQQQHQYQTSNYRSILSRDPQYSNNLSNIPNNFNYAHQQSMPFLSSSYTSNSTFNQNPKVARFGSTASSLSSNILLSSSSSSFSSFSSNFSNESQLARQPNVQQYQNFHQSSNIHSNFMNTRSQNDYSNLALNPPPASTLAMHRASLPNAFHSTRTLTDIVSLEQLHNTSSRLDLQFNPSNNIHINQTPSLNPESADLTSNGLNIALDLEPQKSSIISQTSEIEADTCLTSFTGQSSPIDDFNLATPTQLEPSTNHFNTVKSSSQTHQQKNEFSPANSNTRSNNSTSYNQFYNNMVPSFHAAQQQTHNNQDQYNPLISNGIQVGSGSHNLNNSQISMMIPTPTGFFSRSNSQPDLTLNLEKAVPNSNTYNINNNYCYYFNNNNTSANNNSSSSQVFNSNFNNCFNANTNNISQTTFNTSNNYSSSNSSNDNRSRQKLIRRHPSLSMSYKTLSSECNGQDNDFLADFNFVDYFNNSSGNSNVNDLNNTNQIQTNFNNNTTTTNFATNQILLNKSDQESANLIDDGLFLGTDALTDFLSNCGTLSDLFDDLPEIEDLMSLVTFESSKAGNTSACVADVSMNNQSPAKTQCDLNLPSFHSSSKNGYPLSNYYDYCNTESSNLNQNGEIDENIIDNESSERTTRSAPPSPTSQKKKQRPTINLLLGKQWAKMEENERSKAVDCLTKIINDEMGLREQLEIIRILNPDAKLRPTDKQFVIDLKIIDDDKYKRIKDVIKSYGFYSNDHQKNDNSSDCSANSCPQSYHLAKRELRLKRAQQQFKLKIKKEARQIIKETKSGLFAKTEVVPLSQVLPEEDIEVDILS